MHLLHEVGGLQQVRLARAGRGAAHVHPGHGARAGDDGGAARGAAGVGEMAYLDAGHVGDRAAAVVGGMGHGAAVLWKEGATIAEDARPGGRGRGFRVRSGCSA
jgi:hypothetical protein